MLGLVGCIYDAAGDPDLWPPTLKRLSETLGGHAGALILYDKQPLTPRLHVDDNLDPGEWNRYENHFFKLDRWAQAAQSLPAGSAITDSQIMARDAFLASEWFNDFLNHQRIGGILLGVTANSPARLGAISIYRPVSRDQFGATERSYLHAILPHLRRALVLYSRLTTLWEDSQSLDKVLDRQALGIVFLDDRRRVVFLNAAARALVSARQGLSVIRSGLCASVPAENDRLRGLIRTATTRPFVSARAPDGAMRISRSAGEAPLDVLVVPLRHGRPVESAQIFDRRVAAVVFVSDPETRQETPADVLMRLYGLTPAEARLAEAMAGGGPLTEAAERLGIGRETARSQLKQVFAKTGTRRQAELVRLLLTSPAALTR